MPHDPYKALYIHIPFCAQKCSYCDFFSRVLPDDSPEIDEYFEHLISQIRCFAKQGELSEIETIYLGGGTPSYVGARRLSSLIYLLSHSMRVEPDVEFTLEANPDSISLSLVKDLWALGVNRLSLGVQSLDDTVLQTLGRIHSAQAALDALALVQERFDNVSVDVMCGIPGQSEASLLNTLEQLCERGVKHISVYPLSIEEHTKMAQLLRLGYLEEPDEDVQAHHMKLATQYLHHAGFERYEVANYAIPGYESRHNLSYWSGVPYLGIGASAVTMTQNAERRMRVQDNRVTDDLSRVQMLAEDVMLGMRKSSGVPIAHIERVAHELPSILGCMEELVQLGLVEKTSDAYIPTELGWLCGNELYGKIYELAT